MGVEAVSMQKMWRPNKAARLLSWVVVVCFAAILSLSVAFIIWDTFHGRPGKSLWDISFALAIAGPLALGAWRLGLHPYIALNDQGVEIRNPASWTFLTWPEIEGATAGYYGIEIKTRGRTVTAMAVQKSNAATWFRRKVRADELVVQVNQRAGTT